MRHKLMKIILSSITISLLLTSCISSTPKDSERTSDMGEIQSTQASTTVSSTTSLGDANQDVNNNNNTLAQTQPTTMVDAVAGGVESSNAITQSSMDADAEKQNLLSQLQMNIGQTESTAANATTGNTQAIQNNQTTQSTTAAQNNQWIQQTQPPIIASQPVVVPTQGNDAMTSSDSGMGYIEQKAFGSYMIPAGWSEWTYHSTDSKWFYTKGTPANDAICTNISIQCYTNNYTKDKYEDFLKDLVAFYKEQLTQAEYDSMQMEGISSSKGYPIVKVAINNTDGRRTIQYYIIGDYKHVLIHLTDFNDSITDGDASALYIVDSFQWAQ